MNNIVFVSFENGGGGHRFARTISALPNMYWYSHTDNGINPWNINTKNTTIRQRSVAPAHFDRIVPDGKLPPTWDYVKDFFPFPEYYYSVFKKEFTRLAPSTDKSFVYCTHSKPYELLRWFPECKVINLIHDVDSLVERYMQTTAKFPGWLRMANLVPEDNPHLIFLQCLRESKKDFTFADIWSQRTHGTLYKDDYYSEYKDSITTTFTHRMKERVNTNHQLVLNVKDKNWKEIKQFLK